MGFEEEYWERILLSFILELLHECDETWTFQQIIWAVLEHAKLEPLERTDDKEDGVYPIDLLKLRARGARFFHEHGSEQTLRWSADKITRQLLDELKKIEEVACVELVAHMPADPGNVCEQMLFHAHLASELAPSELRVVSYKVREAADRVSVSGDTADRLEVCCEVRQGPVPDR